MEGATRDALFRGALHFWQPAKGAGYRFNMDSVFLAHFARPSSHCVDLGAGCGVVGLLIIHTKKTRSLTLVERQPYMSELCRMNIEENGAEDGARVVQGDLRELPQLDADTVVFNPPYFPAMSGRPSPVQGKDEGRFERHGTFADFVRAASKILNGAGSMCAIVRADRLSEVKAIAGSHELLIGRERLIRPRIDDAPRNALIELSKKENTNYQQMPDLIIHRGSGRDYTDEVQEIFEEPKSWTITSS